MSITEYENRLHPVQVEIYKKMSAQRKLEILDNLYRTARELKAIGIRRDYPEWTEEDVQNRLREIFLYAHT